MTDNAVTAKTEQIEFVESKETCIRSTKITEDNKRVNLDV